HGEDVRSRPDLPARAGVERKDAFRLAARNQLVLTCVALADAGDSITGDIDLERRAPANLPRRLIHRDDETLFRLAGVLGVLSRLLRNRQDDQVVIEHRRRAEPLLAEPEG